MSNSTYFKTRLTFDKKRSVLWKTLSQYFFQRYIKKTDSVLELGAGYCDFINNIKANDKYAVDLWSHFPECASGEVKTYVQSVTDLSFLPDHSIDFVFASNLFEHLEQNDVARCLVELNRVLKTTGRLAILQPNFRYAFKHYFDDYTHQSIWTDVSLGDFLSAQGFSIEKCWPRFLPLSIKSKFPVFGCLIRLYLKSPFKPLAQQMLIIAKPVHITLLGN